MMPGTDGYEVCELLKAEEDTKEIPVVFLTAKTDVEDKIRGFELGAADYITKPFNLIEIATRVQSLLRLKYLEEQNLRYQKTLMQVQPWASLGTVGDVVAHRYNTMMDELHDVVQKIQKKSARDDSLQKTTVKALKVLERMDLVMKKWKELTLQSRGEKESVDLNRVIEDAVVIVRDEVNEMVDVQFSRQEITPFVFGNPGLLQLSFIYLIMNISEVVNGKGTVSIQLDKGSVPKSLAKDLNSKHDENAYVRVDVIDDRMWAEGENVEREMDLFIKTKKHARMGLVLSAISGIAKIHGGVVDISTQKKKGTTVSIYLPSHKS
jgi:two-component system sensor histidine kinase/response regulator